MARVLDFSDGHESASEPLEEPIPASAVANTPSGNLAATNAQTALNELQTDIDTRATSASLTAHIDDTTDAHAASAITNTPSGNLAATTVQTALDELQSTIDALPVGGYTVTASKTSAYNVVNGDYVLCDSSGGTFAVTLPTATAGHKVAIKKTDSSFTAVSITGTVDGVSGNSVNTQFECLELIADGTSWYTVSRRIPSAFGATTTLTVGAVTTPPTKGTIVRDSVVSRRVGDSQESIVHYIQSGGSPAAGSGIYLYTIPNGLSVDTSDVTVSASVTSDGLDDATLLGQGFAQRSGAHGGHVLAYAYDATRFYLRWGIIADTTGTTLSAESSNAMASGSAVNFGHNMSLHLHLKIPISGWRG